MSKCPTASSGIKQSILITMNAHYIDHHASKNAPQPHESLLDAQQIHYRFCPRCDPLAPSACHIGHI
eukprot:5852499-Pleurochrysis_carterae.AAC.4